MLPITGLLKSVTAWIESEASIKVAVIFGSSARELNNPGPADRWSDIDIQVVTTDVRGIEQLNWKCILPEEKYCLQILRPATGGVRKITVLFEAGQIDLVIIPASQLYMARLAMFIGLQKYLGRLQTALNEIHASIRMGYRFVKGKDDWETFYEKIRAEMPGVRLTNSEARNLADVFICEMLWIFQKLDRGELSAAQRALHCSLAETNFRLLRELRLRNGGQLPSFGLARHVETILPSAELAWVQVDARLTRSELRRATWNMLIGLTAIMMKLSSEWNVSPPMMALLSQFSESDE